MSTRVALLCLSILASCTHTAHERREFEASSTLDERAQAMQSAHANNKKNSPKNPESPAQESFVSAPALPTNMQNELIADGLKALEQGDTARALERAYSLWQSLDIERSRSPETDLQKPVFRNPALLLALAQAESSQGADTSLAERLVRVNPQWEPAYIVLANAHMRRGAFLLAEKVTRAGFDRIENTSPSFLALRIKSLYSAGRKEQAMRLATTSLTAHPTHSRLLQWKGTLLFLNQKNAEACALFEKAFSASQPDAPLSHNHAVCLTQTAQLEEALSVLKAAMATHPQHAPLRLLAGTVLKKLGKNDDARIAWREYLNLNDTNANARNAVAAALANLDLSETSGQTNSRATIPLSQPVTPY